MERTAVTPYPDDHAGRVAEWTGRIAARLGFPDDVCARWARAARWHDIGKQHIPRSILDKPGPLSPAERREVERHPALGASMLAAGPPELRETACVIALTHHERWDGSGYPFGLRGEEIPLVARIVAVADVFDCLCTDRPYKQAYPQERACAILQEGAGTLFDPVCVRALEEVVRAADGCAPQVSRRDAPVAIAAPARRRRRRVPAAAA